MRGSASCSVVVLGDEAHLPYNRTPLAKDQLASPPTHDAVAFPLRSSLHEVEWRPAQPVAAADLTQRCVRLRNGDIVDFDILVAATGVRPRRLPVPGPVSGRYTLRTLEDAVVLHEVLRPGARVVVVGAGFLGCEVAATAGGLGCRVDVVAVDEQPMVQPLGSTVGAAVRRRHEARGVRFHLGRSVATFNGTDRVDGVALDDGTELAADVVVEAVGSVCNTEWLVGNGLDLTDGVLTDARLRANHPTPVYAVGDVVRYPNRRFDEVPRRVEHWNLAIDTGRAAARSTLEDLGASAPASQGGLVPYFWSDQYDLKIQSYGSPDLGTSIEVLDGELDGHCAVGYYRDSRLVGVVLFNLQRAAMEYRTRVVEATGDSGQVPTSAGRLTTGRTAEERDDDSAAAR